MQENHVSVDNDQKASIVWSGKCFDGLTLLFSYSLATVEARPMQEKDKAKNYSMTLNRRKNIYSNIWLEKKLLRNYSQVLELY